MRTNITIDVPDEIIQKWQNIVDLMAELIDAPAGLIMRLDKSDIEVFVSSHTQDNPYHPGDRELFNKSGLYCEKVITKKQELFVPNALQDTE